MTQNNLHRNLFTASILVVSFVGAILLFRSEQDFRYRAGEVAQVPSAWPQSTTIVRASNKPCLLVFVHEECPCTRATLTELEKICSASGQRADVKIVFVDYKLNVRPIGSNLWNLAAQIKGADEICVSPSESKKFGATTSGTVELFDRAGALIYHGGITDGRGHEGDNAGEDAVISLLNDGTAQVRSTPTYGCAL